MEQNLLKHAHILSKTYKKINFGTFGSSFGISPLNSLFDKALFIFLNNYFGIC